MTAQENTAAIKQAYEAFAHGDIQRMLEMMTDDVHWTFPGPQDVIPYAGEFKGRAAVARYFEVLAANEDIQAFERREFVAEGDSVVVCGYYRSRVKATGREIEGEWVETFHMRNGKIVSSQYYVDTAAMGAAYSAA